MEDSRTQAARKHFDRWARTYEDDRASQRLRELQREALAALDLGPDDGMLDVGCGTGAAVREAALTASRAAGFDLSPAMIARARTLADGVENVDFHEGDATGALPFADGEFSAVLCTTAFHHFTAPARALAEMARILGPGGRLVIADANADRALVRVLDIAMRMFQRSHVGFPRPSRLIADLRRLGFTTAEVRTLWSGGYAIVRAAKPA